MKIITEYDFFFFQEKSSCLQCVHSHALDLVRDEIKAYFAIIRLWLMKFLSTGCYGFLKTVIWNFLHLLHFKGKMNVNR